MPASDDNTSLWRHTPFQRLFWAHALSLIGTGISSVALGLLAHELVGASATVVLGMTLTIRIVVVVTCAPWVGGIAERFGARATLLASDFMRAGVVLGFFYVEAVWQIYVLAFILNLGSAVFTPVYKALIPEVVGRKRYARALALGSVAYDTANIMGPALAGLLIAFIGFRGGFVVDAFSFLLSAGLIFGLPRMARPLSSSDLAQRSPTMKHGLAAMLKRRPLRQSLFLALQTSVSGAFVLVATVDFVKEELQMPDSAYAWAMAVYGFGSVAGATLYAHSTTMTQNRLVPAATVTLIASLGLISALPTYAVLMLAWILAGSGQSILGIRGNELLAAHSEGAERPHIYAAHFSLSHAGWGLTYPLAGVLTAAVGFQTTAWIFGLLLVVVSILSWKKTLGS
jgi:MFS family permease